MVRCRVGESSRVPRIVQEAFAPVHAQFITVFREGVAAGELRDLEPEPTLISLMGAFLFYFVSEPFRPEASNWDLCDPACIQIHRESMLAFAAAALFMDRTDGAAAIQAALSQCPGPCVPWMPAIPCEGVAS
jgi:hypothetical protein